jgi:hypothetical protein
MAIFWNALHSNAPTLYRSHELPTASASCLPTHLTLEYSARRCYSAVMLHALSHITNHLIASTGKHRLRQILQRSADRPPEHSRVDSAGVKITQKSHVKIGE